MNQHQESQPVAVLIDLEVEPRHQAELAMALAENVERHLAGFDGFVSATFLASTDGRSVVNHAVWRSERDLEAFRGSGDAGQAEREALFARCGARPVAVRTYRIARAVAAG